MLFDCNSSALVGPDDPIDWLCFPCYDSPALFVRVLDREAGRGLIIAARALDEAA